MEIELGDYVDNYVHDDNETEDEEENLDDQNDNDYMVDNMEEVEVSEGQSSSGGGGGPARRLWQQTHRFLQSSVGGSPRAVYVFDFDKTLTLHPMSSHDMGVTRREEIDRVRAKIKPYVLDLFAAFVRANLARGNICIVLSFCSSTIVNNILQNFIGDLRHGRELLVVCPDNFENKSGREVHDESSRYSSLPHRNMKYRFLHTFLQRTPVEANQVLFFDDRKKHLRAVRHLGVHTIRVFDVDHPSFHVGRDAIHKLITDFHDEVFYDKHDVKRFGSYLRKYVSTTRVAANSDEED